MDERIKNLNYIFDAFDIGAKCIAYEKKQHMSLYDVSLNPGTRIKEIERFSEEIALSLKFKNKPFIRPISEMGIVRLEVADELPEKISFFDEIIEKEFPKDYTIPMYLGNTIDGNPLWTDLVKNPHILIGGCTGSGKSTMLHTIIANSLINDVRLFLIDTKNIEFSPYKSFNGVDIANNYQDASIILETLVEVMEKRFEIIKNNQLPSSIFTQKNTILPHIVLIIDEYADIALQDTDKTFKKNLTKLTQKSRAAGIYCILATQRPSVDLIDGTIKANFPARIACKTSSYIDSKVILDYKGSELLIGCGDAIIKNYDNELVRFQSTFTTQQEILEYIKK